MRKLGWIIIGGIFFAMLWIILALAVPSVGQGSYTLFFVILGPGIVNGIIGISNTIMTWGTTGFPQAMAVFFGIGVTWLIIGIGFSRLIWPHIPYIHKKAIDQTVREEPRDIIITQTPVATAQEKKETLVTESASTAS